jgi:hypothetical protein
MAAELAEHDDWQPRWRLALLQRRVGNYTASNATFTALLADFTGARDATLEPDLASQRPRRCLLREAEMRDDIASP